MIAGYFIVRVKLPKSARAQYKLTIFTDRSVFIWGGVRALERLCVQLCKEWGCQVTCLAPVYTHHYLTRLGAAHVLPDDMADLAKLIQSGKRLFLFSGIICLTILGGTMSPN